MGILNKFSINEIIDAINSQNKKLICSVPGIGQKMTERLFLELKNKFKDDIQKHKNNHKYEFFHQNIEKNKMIDDLLLTLQSLNYKKKEINTILPIIIEELDISTKNENNHL